MALIPPDALPALTLQLRGAGVRIEGRAPRECVPAPGVARVGVMSISPPAPTARGGVYPVLLIPNGDGKNM